MADEPQYASIQVYLTVKGADAASRFYQKAFGAKENQRQVGPDGTRLIHCDMSVFGGNLMFSDEFPEGGHGEVDTLSPVTRGGASATVHVNLKSPNAVERVMTAAANEGARITMPAEKTFWGAYYGRLIDPFGHSWSFGAPGVEPPAAARPRRKAAARKAPAKKAAARNAPVRKAAPAKKAAGRKATAKRRPSRTGKR
jgi:PhnB protein